MGAIPFRTDSNRVDPEEVLWLIFIKRNQFCADVSATQVLTPADIRADPLALACRCIFWFMFIVFLMAGVSALGLEAINRLISEFFLYLPRIFAALLILLVGFLISNFLSRAALLAAVNANMPSPRIVGGVVKLLIVILVFAVALEQLQIVRSIVTAASAIAFGAVMLGLAIVFGLGGRDVARHVLEQRFLERKEEPDKFSHI